MRFLNKHHQWKIGQLIAGALIPVTPTWVLYGGAAIMLGAIALAVNAEHRRAAGS
mgnify:CR=1 FL=1